MVFADAVDEQIASHVAEQIAAFQLNGVSIDRAWEALTGREPMAGCITWDHVSNKVEDSYREMNLLPPRKNKKLTAIIYAKLCNPEGEA